MIRLQLRILRRQNRIVDAAHDARAVVDPAIPAELMRARPLCSPHDRRVPPLKRRKASRILRQCAWRWRDGAHIGPCAAAQGKGERGCEYPWCIHGLLLLRISLYLEQAEPNLTSDHKLGIGA
jgi:hypothetical protein